MTDNRALMISIHTPLAGRDRRQRRRSSFGTHFNPHAPCGARRYTGQRYLCDSYFNPHAPCGARHQIPVDGLQGFSNFNPHAPCGARPRAVAEGVDLLLFQSTRPLRGATQVGAKMKHNNQISIHTPLAGRDYALCCFHGYEMISIHAPLAGRDQGLRVKIATVDISIHAPLAGRDSAARLLRLAYRSFQSTRPLRGAT